MSELETALRHELDGLADSVAVPARIPDSLRTAVKRRRALRRAGRYSAGAATAVSLGVTGLFVRSLGDQSEEIVSPATAPSVASSTTIENTVVPSSEPGARNTTAPTIPVAETTSVLSGPIVPAPPSEPLANSAPLSCAFEYNLKTLVDRAFAFDGTVVSIAGGTVNTEFDRTSPQFEVDVAFQVNEWFKGGGPSALSVQMMPPASRLSIDQTAIGGRQWGVGSRLLISGEPRWGGTALNNPVVWLCGFSRTYDTTTAADWRAAFAEADSSTASFVPSGPQD